VPKPWGLVVFRGCERGQSWADGAAGPGSWGVRWGRRGGDAEGRAQPGCRLKERPFDPVMWRSPSGPQSRAAATRSVFGEGTSGLDGAHRRPLCRWARVQHHFAPDAAGGAARPRTADPVPPLCSAPQCRSRGSREAVVSEQQW
jgi:hypothetical protein